MRKLLSSLFLSVTPAPARGAMDDGLDALDSAAEHMGPDGAQYAHAAVANWGPEAAAAESRLPTRF